MERGLDLSHQGLTAIAQIPRDVTRHVERDGKLYALSLAQNRLTKLQDIHVFQHAVQLDLSGNQLHTLDGIGSLRLLESLNVARNALVSIDVLVELPRLRVLNAAENRLEDIDAVSEWKAIIALDVSFNNISKWPELVHAAALETIDLSSNVLEGLPVASAGRAFPPGLRRLSLAKNRINSLCGVASLGLYLEYLQVIKLDGNPATQRVLREGGSLDFLWVNLFASVVFTKGVTGACRDDFVVPQDVVAAVEDAVQRGDEAMLLEFLLTGTISTQRRWPQATIDVAPKDTRSVAEHAKYHEVSAPSRLQTPPVSDPTRSAEVQATLSKESKMELWKRMMDERKAQEQRDKDKLVGPTHSAPAVPPPAPVVVRDDKMTYVNDVNTRPVVKAAPSNPPPKDPYTEALASQMKTLHEHVAGMRKYVKVWVKREQMTREAAAKRIQRLFRRRQGRLWLSMAMQRSRVRRHREYSVEPCSSCRLMSNVPSDQLHLHLYAVTIQRHVRGWLSRERVSRWMYYTQAVERIQYMWRRQCGHKLQIKLALKLKESKRSLEDAVISLAADVRQLQRVFVVQEQVIAAQWEEIRRYKRLVRATLEPQVTRLQSLWRGYIARKRLDRVKLVVSTPPPLHQNAEVHELRLELVALKAQVEKLLAREKDA